MPVLSYTERERLVRSLLGEWVWICDLYDDEVIIETYTDKVTIEGHELENGSLYKWKYSIDDKGVCTLTGKPEPVMRKVSYQKVKYSANFAVVEEDQEWVYREGKVWELAYYADKISVTEDELDRAISNFKPVPINLEHMNTPLDGKLGAWEKIWRVGADVFGRLRIPKWLDELFKGEALKTSVEFTPNRLFEGIAICNYPRVADAAIFAAFTAHDKGLRTKKTEAHNNGGKMNWVQIIKGWFNKGEQLPADAIEQLKAAGFDPATAEAQFTETKPTGTPPDQKVSPEVQAALEAMQVQQQQYADQLASAESRSLLAAAKEFCRGYVEKKKMLPAEVEGMTKLFQSAVRNDAAQAKTACFSQDGSHVEGENVKAIKAMLDARPDFFMAGEAIRGSAGNTMGKMSDDRRLELLGMGTIKVKAEAKS